VQQAASGIGRRNLRGRCGGPRVRRRKPPTPSSTSRFGRLPLSGAGVEVRSGEKGASLSIARPPSPKERGGVTRGRAPATNVTSAEVALARAGLPEGRKHPDCRDDALLRGRRRDGDLGRTSCGGPSSPPANMPPDDHRVLGTLRRRGALDTLSRLVRENGEAPSLRTYRPTFALSHCLNHPRCNRRWDCGAASHAALQGAVAFGALPSGTLVVPGDGVDGAGVARCLLLPGRGGAVAGRAFERTCGKRRSTHRHGPSKGDPRSRRARIGRSRSCSRVIAVVAEVVRQWPAQKSGRSSISPDLEAFQGRAPSSTLQRTARYAAAGEPTLASSSKRKPHVTAPERGCDPRVCAGSCRWKASRIVVVGGSSRTARRHGLGWTGTERCAKAKRNPRESDRGVRGTEAPEARGRTRRATNPEPPAEADRAL
jgi:hypothetical protein